MEGHVGVPVGSGWDGGLSRTASVPHATACILCWKGWEKRQSWVFKSPHPPQQLFSCHGTEAKILSCRNSLPLLLFFFNLFDMIGNAIQPRGSGKEYKEQNDPAQKIESWSCWPEARFGQIWGAQAERGCHLLKFHMGGLLHVCNKNLRCNKRRKKNI